MNDGLKDKFRQTLTDIPTANPRVEWVMRHWTLHRSGRM